MFGVAWHDSETAHFLSTIPRQMAADQSDGQVLRRQKGVSGRQTRSAPFAAVDYNKISLVHDLLESVPVPRGENESHDLTRIASTVNRREARRNCFVCYNAFKTESTSTLECLTCGVGMHTTECERPW
jgi:hypothetical protein